MNHPGAKEIFGQGRKDVPLNLGAIDLYKDAGAVAMLPHSRAVGHQATKDIEHSRKKRKKELETLLSRNRPARNRRWMPHSSAVG